MGKKRDLVGDGMAAMVAATPLPGEVDRFRSRIEELEGALRERDGEWIQAVAIALIELAPQMNHSAVNAVLDHARRALAQTQTRDRGDDD